MGQEDKAQDWHPLPLTMLQDTASWPLAGLALAPGNLSCSLRSRAEFFPSSLQLSVHGILLPVFASSLEEVRLSLAIWLKKVPSSGHPATRPYRTIGHHPVHLFPVRPPHPPRAEGSLGRRCQEPPHCSVLRALGGHFVHL